MDPLSIIYRYTLADGLHEEFRLQLHPETLLLIRPQQEEPPSWTRMDYQQCSNCSFTDEGNILYCPVALNLIELVNRFARLSSYDRMFVEVVTDVRTYRKKTSAQRGISSLMGLLIATSDCPMTDFFKPMARFHLPFATSEETIWRATSTYMLSQYFLGKQDGYTDLDMKGLNRIYQNIQKLNSALARRLRGACARDSTINAIIILDAFAQSLPFIIETSLEKIEPFIRPVMKQVRNTMACMEK